MYVYMYLCIYVFIKIQGNSNEVDSINKLEQAMFGDVGSKGSKIKEIDSSMNKSKKVVNTKQAGKKQIFQPAMSDNRRRITGE